jgi:hypothetical protein
MKKLLYPIVFAVLSVCPSYAEGVIEADKLAHEYCKKEFAYMGNYADGDSRVVHKKQYLERILELGDGKLIAYYAKDVIGRDIAMYQNFLSTKKVWRNSDLTEDQAKDFAALIAKLERDYNVIKGSYPTDYEVFKRLQEKVPVPEIQEREQEGREQPATRSESDSEGSDKPQPESGERSR